MDAEKHIAISEKSPYGGGREGRVKRKTLKSKNKKPEGGAAADDE